MNREIKFRAWEKNLKEMILVEEIDFNSLMINQSTAWRFIDEVELMQYTGLKDKNGIEIYEDDLVAEEHGRIYRVVFKGDCWRCEPISRGSKNRWLSNYLEIIGNIYENPELLERSE